MGYFERTADEAIEHQEYLEQAASDLNKLEDFIYYRYNYHSNQSTNMDETSEYRMRHMHLMNLLIEMAQTTGLELPK